MLLERVPMSVAEEKYSTRFEQAAGKPGHRGAYGPEDAQERGMALVEVKHKDTKLYWLVDQVEDRIYSARFFSYGGKLSLAIGETLCAMVEGLTLPEACSLIGGDVEKKLRDEPDSPAVPESKVEAFDRVEVLLKSAEEGYPSAKALALASAALSKEKPKSTAELTMAEQAWLGLSKSDQIAQLDLVLDEKIRPALMNDGGNVQVMDVIDGEKVLIQYQGACGSCGSSLGGTLSFIEQALRKDVYKGLIITPTNTLL